MKNLKTALLALVVAFAILFVGCSGDSGNSTTPANTEETKKSASQPINVVSREAGSGTRGAFTEITKIITKNDKGEEEDRTTIEATIANATDAVVTTITGDKNAIGYISLSSLNDTVKAIKVNGVEASPEEIAAGNYPIARPFELAYKEAELSDLAKDFLKFCMSAEGQAIVEEDGCIKVAGEESYKPANIEGTLTIAGSTSVTPLMEKLVDGYKALNPGFKADIQSSGSGAGIKAAIEGLADIGMSSRKLKDEEKAELQYSTLGMDGIAVIVNKENTVEDLTVDQIRSIYIGETKYWDEVK